MVKIPVRVGLDAIRHRMKCSTYHSVASRRISSLNMGSNSTSAELIVRERWTCGLFGGAMMKDGCCCRDEAAGLLSAEVDGRLF